MFRALSDYDELNYRNNEDIKCLLLKSFEEKRNSFNVKKYYDLCIQGKGKYALDTVVGHVQGGKLKKETSCWISTSSCFDLVCSEYAVPQSGKYNQFDKRKNVIAIEVDKNSILSDISKIKELREQENLPEIFLDLRNSALARYYNNCLYSETFNEDMPGYDCVKSLNQEFFGLTTSVKGFSNFSTNACEVLSYKTINRDLIKALYFPLQQDILYGNGSVCDLDLNILEDSINDLSIKLKTFFDLLYPTIESGISLTDVLFDNYKAIAGVNVEEKYQYLKSKKCELLKSLVEIMNSKSLICHLSINRLVDDKVLVYRFDRKLKKSEVNDVVILEVDNELYRYNHQDNSYVQGNKKILKKEFIETSRSFVK